MNLEELQREMAAAVMQPLTADETMQPRDTTGRWNGREMDSVAAEFIRPNNRLTSFERLEIYNRQYWFRLQSAFAEDFETLANAYMAAHPSRSFTLRNLGSKLAEWLEANPSYAGRRLALALDVVRVEWACIEAFDNAELPPLSLAEVASVSGESRLGLQPHVQLLSLAYPADDLVLAMHQKQRRESSEAGTRAEDAFDSEESLQPIHVRKRATWLAIHRADFSLYYRSLSRPEFQTLSALRDGLTVPEALEAGFVDSKLPDARRVRLVQQWFATWAQLGWICAADANAMDKKGKE
jgi:hypothetical protein